MNSETTLAVAEQRLQDLREAEQQIRQELSDAIDQASPHAMILNRSTI